MPRTRTDAECAVHGCTRQATTRGWCNRHYQRWQATGSADSPTPTQARHQDADEVLFLLSCGVALNDALTRVGWTHAGAYRWALRHNRHDLQTAVSPTSQRRQRSTA